jgi:transcriptional regulator with XRE-family HTH domain
MATEWIGQEDAHDEGVAMALGERIKELRKEHGWSQAELGERVSTDSQRISRYENGRITPSVDALVRLADALGVSIDYLVRDDMPRHVLEGHDLGKFAGRLEDLAELGEDDQQVVAQVVDGLLAKSRLKALAGGIA